jgi:hypothetical protein
MLMAMGFISSQQNSRIQAANQVAYPLVVSLQIIDRRLHLAPLIRRHVRRLHVFVTAVECHDIGLYLGCHHVELGICEFLHELGVRFICQLVLAWFGRVTGIKVAVRQDECVRAFTKQIQLRTIGLDCLVDALDVEVFCLRRKEPDID